MWFGIMDGRIVPFSCVISSSKMCSWFYINLYYHKRYLCRESNSSYLKLIYLALINWMRYQWQTLIHIAKKNMISIYQQRTSLSSCVNTLHLNHHYKKITSIKSSYIYIYMSVLKGKPIIYIIIIIIMSCR